MINNTVCATRDRPSRNLLFIAALGAVLGSILHTAPLSATGALEAQIQAGPAIDGARNNVNRAKEKENAPKETGTGQQAKEPVTSKPSPRKTAAPKTATRKATAPKAAVPKRSASAKSKAGAARKPKTGATAKSSASVPPVRAQSLQPRLLGRRDPFKALGSLSASVTGGQSASSEILGSLPAGTRGLVISQLLLQGLVRQDLSNTMIAVVANPNKRAYFLRENDVLYNGVVSKITPDAVYFKENYLDLSGQVSSREVVRRMGPAPGEVQ